MQIKDLFNTNYYLTHNPDVAAAEDGKPSAPSKDASANGSLDHFIKSGQFEGRDPSALFSESYYLQHNPDVQAFPGSAIQHFIQYGADEGRSPSYLFDKEYYLKSNPDVAAAKINPFEHFIEHGEQEGRSPTYLFDKDYYLSHNADVKASGMNPVEHFLEYGLTEGRVPTALFDKDYYLAHNTDVAASGMNAFQHFMEYGQYENRATSASFNSLAYLQANPDVAAAIQKGTIDSAIEHYILFGKTEGRKTVAPSSLSNGDGNNNGGGGNHNGGGDNGGGDNGGGDNGGGDTTHAPVNTVPSSLETDSDLSFAIHGLSVADDDSTNVTVTLSITHGTLSISDTVEGGVGADHIDGTGTEYMLDGTLAEINATLASGISFMADDGFSGAAVLTIKTSDGSHQDVDTVTITVNAVETGTIMELTPDSDNLVATEGAVIFSTSQSDFDESDTLVGSSDTDTLLFTDTCDIIPDNLHNKSGIDVIKLSDNDNNIVISSDFVQASDNGMVEINNRTFTVTYLDTSDVGQEGVVIGGTGVVTLADDVSNYITIKDDVNGTIMDGTGDDTIIGGTGDDTITLIGGDNSIYGGDGDDTFISDIDSFTVGNSIDGGDGHDMLVLNDTTDIDPDMLENLSSIEVIRFLSDDSHVALSDSFVQSADNQTVELDIGTATIGALDTSDLSEDSHVVINGSGTVLLADDVSNTVYVSDDNGASIIGGTGDDNIVGGASDDTIAGGEGQDILTGGDGADMFVFMSVSDSGSDLPDTIMDFDSANDVIVLSDLGYTGIAEGDAEGDALGFSNDGENTTIVDASGNFMIVLVGIHTDLSDVNVQV